MNKYFFYALSFTLFFFTSCAKEPSHSIRVNNQYIETINELKINSTDYGTVLSGSISDYKPINEGNFTMSGKMPSGATLTGSGTVTGKGTHLWTITISNAGLFTILEDR